MTRLQIEQVREHTVEALNHLCKCHRLTRDSGLLYEITGAGIQSVAVLETALDSIQGRNELSRIERCQ